jgi:hypothetical protein
MEWVYLAVVVVALVALVLGIVYRGLLKSWSLKIGVKPNELSGEFTGEAVTRLDATQAQPPSSSGAIRFSGNKIAGKTSVTMDGSDLVFDSNKTQGVSNIDMRGKGIDVSDNEMADETSLNLRSERTEIVFQPQANVISLGEARLQEQDALPPASAPMMETETVIHPELEQRG